MLRQLFKNNLPIIVAFSGGKDSVAMVLYLLELGIPKERIHLHHHDVDGNSYRPIFDWECTKDYCRAFAQAFGLKLFISYREGGIYREINRENQPKGDVYYQIEPDGEYQIARAKADKLNTRLMFPAVQSDIRYRWCSATAKIEVLRTVTSWSEAYQKGCYVLTGERRAESTARSKYDYQEVYHTSNKNRPIQQLRIILDWSEAQVWDILKRWRVQPHPAYMLGWSRCSCKICIFSGPNIWATVNEIDKPRIEMIDMTEKKINHTLYHKLTILEKVAQGTAMKVNKYWLRQSIKFTVPIIVPENKLWKIPVGAFSMEKSGAV
jgi:3'-phosphoadenosine 5'-phosphosulfate sulfotransferase (PAPS reductase)/FAD synthetase